MPVGRFQLDFSESNFRKNMDEINRVINNIQTDNLDGQVVTLKDCPIGEIQLSHSLKAVPKFRLILRQIGGGHITDVSGKWYDTYITIFNNGTSKIDELSILILRG